MHISKSTRVLALALLGGISVLFALAAAQQPSSTKPSLPGPGAQRSDAKTDGAKGNALAAKTDSIVHEALARVAGDVRRSEAPDHGARRQRRDAEGRSAWWARDRDEHRRAQEARRRREREDRPLQPADGSRAHRHVRGLRPRGRSTLARR